MIKKLTRKKGFSLVEVIIASFIICSGFLVLLSVVVTSMKFSLQCRNRIFANIAANSILEELSAHSYGNTEPSFWHDPVIFKTYIQGHKEPSLVAYHKEINYSNGSFVGMSGQTDVAGSTPTTPTTPTVSSYLVPRITIITTTTATGTITTQYITYTYLRYVVIFRRFLGGINVRLTPIQPDKPEENEDTVTVRVLWEEQIGANKEGSKELTMDIEFVRDDAVK
jgi:type II secretory pathway pseudopilin PulG